ncbi:hypothetical protein E1A91_A02G168800v1 [Gossypium mustelinum]|uniref:Uncharacterized protein n=1 Tax=Gossypium mustelinum TaxID=34275 RepID=A0A5D3A8K0_GOSMU|nr:hypothetical protein E1A91_A02G168800v1 [Gossypium mustelinum]
MHEQRPDLTVEGSTRGNLMTPLDPSSNFDLNEVNKGQGLIRKARLYAKDDPVTWRPHAGVRSPLSYAIPLYSKSFWHYSVAELLFGSCWASDLGYL